MSGGVPEEIFVKPTGIQYTVVSVEEWKCAKLDIYPIWERWTIRTVMKSIVGATKIKRRSGLETRRDPRFGDGV